MEKHTRHTSELPVKAGLIPTTVKLQASGSEDEPDLSLLDLWRIVKKRRKLILSCTFGLAFAALVASLLMTPKYISSATLEVNSQATDMLGGIDNAAGSMLADGMEYNVAVQTQMEILKADALALQVARELDLEHKPPFAPKKRWIRIPSFSFFKKEKPVNHNVTLEESPERRTAFLSRFHSDLKVKQVSGTRMIEVSYLNPDPELARDVVNTLVNDYIERHFRSRWAATTQTSNWLSKQLKDLKAQVQDAQERAVAYQRENGILMTDETHNVVTAKLAELNSRLTAAESNRIIKEAIYKMSQSSQDPSLLDTVEGAESLPGAASARSSMSLVPTLRMQLADLRSQYAQLSGKFGPSYPRLQQLQKQIDDVEHSVETERTRTRDRIRAEYLASVQSERMLKEQFEKQKTEANHLNDRAINFTILKREADTSRELYETLNKKLGEAGLLAGIRSSNIDVVDQAYTDAEPTKPRTLLNTALGFALGLFGGLCLAFVLENMDESLRTPDQVEAKVGLPSLGVVPNLRAASRNARFSTATPIGRTANGNLDFRRLAEIGPTSEAYRALRTSILLSSPEHAPCTLMVTSALPGEGKTTTAISLAIALTQLGSRVLLVEADMRRPTLHSCMDLAMARGLSTVLTGQSKLQESVANYDSVPGLSILPAGPKPPNPAELLASKNARQFFQSLAQEYDHVVIDTPPVLAVTDASLLGAIADCVVFVARFGQTSTNAVIRARETLERINVRITGVVINCTDMRSAEYDYYTEYNYEGLKN